MNISIILKFQGPPLTFWYGLLDKTLGSKTKSSALKKVFIDQVIFAPFFLAAILGLIGIVQGNSIDYIKKKLEHDYTDVLKNNYKVFLLCLVMLCSLKLTVIFFFSYGLLCSCVIFI